MKIALWIILSIIVFSILVSRFFPGGQGGMMRFIKVASEFADRDPVIAPDFSGGGKWLNSEPLTIQALRGKVVVVDFWTYSCINCQRTLPYLRAWWEKYRDRGLVIIGVHTPEFEFEKDIGNLREAILKYGVTWPVVQDNDYRIWTAYSNHFWPHKYLVDRDGKIVYEHIGEGAYEETERRIQEFLGISDTAVMEEPSSGSIQFGPSLTPELYMTSRGQTSSHLGKGRDRVELLGNWETGEDFSAAGEGARLRLVFQASEVNLVMSLPDARARTVRVMVDDSESRSLTISSNDLYSLWKGTFGEHMLVMEVDPGLRIHAFTFGR